MDPSTHHALIVGIDKYPQFRTLKGAEGDANDFEEWLTTGMGVPAANIKKLVSSQYTFDDVYGAMPIAQDIHAWLSDLERRAAAMPGVDFPLGERVYIVFACHGYNAVTAQQTAIFPQTRPSYWDVIPLAPLKTDLQTSAYFREIVVIGDACRDQIDYAVDPIWPRKVQTHPNAGKVQLFEAYARPGQKTKEMDFGGRVRGVLTQAFLHGVRGAAADGDGRVWAHRLESLVRAAVADKLENEGLPTIDAPKPPSPPLLICTTEQRLPKIVLEPTNGASGTAMLRSMFDDSEVPLDLSAGRQEFLVPPGFYTLVSASGSKNVTAAWEETHVTV